MTPASRAALRLAAEKATSGPWECRENGNLTEVRQYGCGYRPTICDDETYYPTAVAIENQRFIAAANPAVIIDLLTALDRAEAVVAAAVDIASDLDLPRDCVLWQTIMAHDAHSRSAGQAGQSTDQGTTP